MTATYAALRDQFAWEVPAAFNIGIACCDRHPPGDLALLDVGAGEEHRTLTFGELTELSNRFGNVLRGLGVREGDRVAIVLPQRLETAVAHLAIYKIGAIAVPLSSLFGLEALSFRLGNCAPRVIVTEDAHAGRAGEAAPGDAVILSVDDRDGFWGRTEAAAPDLLPAATTGDTPALLIYTSGTTGPPKGALHGHRVLIGHLPGFELSHDIFPRPGDRFWTPADWAWIGGLMDALMPALFHGVPVIAARRAGFDPAWALGLMERHDVRNVFFPPTAVRLLSRAGVDTAARPRLRSMMSGGEPLGAEVLAWAQQEFGVTINEIYGQTEANYLVGNSSAVWPVRPGSMGLPYPGHRVEVHDSAGAPVAPGEVGQIVVRAPDPVIFLEYFGAPEATRAKFDAAGEWLLTGDLATRDEDGYLWFESRNDDVINSAGYRIGPFEIERCLTSHPAVLLAGAVGVPDATRGETVKAFVTLADGFVPGVDLQRAIQQHVREGVAAFAYPRDIEFLDEMPMTTTGKIRRAALRQRHAGRLDKPQS